MCTQPNRRTFSPPTRTQQHNTKRSTDLLSLTSTPPRLRHALSCRGPWAVAAATPKSRPQLTSSDFRRSSTHALSSPQAAARRARLVLYTSPLSPTDCEMTNANQRRLYKQSKQQQQPQPQSGGSVHPPAAEGDNRRQEGQAGLSQSTGSKRKRTDASSETTAAEGSSAAKRRETDSTSEPTAATDADSPALPLSAPLPVPSSHTKSAALEYLRQWREEKDMWSVRTAHRGTTVLGRDVSMPHVHRSLSPSYKAERVGLVAHQVPSSTIAVLLCAAAAAAAMPRRVQPGSSTR